MWPFSELTPAVALPVVGGQLARDGDPPSSTIHRKHSRLQTSEIEPQDLSAKLDLLLSSTESMALALQSVERRIARVEMHVGSAASSESDRRTPTRQPQHAEAEEATSDEVRVRPAAQPNPWRRPSMEEATSQPTDDLRKVAFKGRRGSSTRPPVQAPKPDALREAGGASGECVAAADTSGDIKDRSSITQVASTFGRVLDMTDIYTVIEQDGKLQGMLKDLRPQPEGSEVERKSKSKMSTRKTAITARIGAVRRNSLAGWLRQANTDKLSGVPGAPRAPDRSPSLCQLVPMLHPSGRFRTGWNIAMALLMLSRQAT